MASKCIGQIHKPTEGTMLVLRRQSMERIHIGDKIVVTILEVRGNSVRLGIDAPREIDVVRSELRDEIAHLPTGVGPVRVAGIDSQVSKLSHGISQLWSEL